MLKPPLDCLRKRTEFLRVSKTIHKWVAPAFIIQIYHREDLGPFRYGITASRKLGNAIMRNRAKRRLRALIRETFPVLAHPGVDYVLIARHEILKRNFAVMRQELIQGVTILHKKTLS